VALIFLVKRHQRATFTVVSNYRSEQRNPLLVGGMLARQGRGQGRRALISPVGGVACSPPWNLPQSTAPLVGLGFRPRCEVWLARSPCLWCLARRSRGVGARSRRRGGLRGRRSRKRPPRVKQRPLRLSVD
jgi:hypothetical protein